MPDYTPIEALRETLSSEPGGLTPETFNAIIRAIKAAVFGADGVVDGGGQAFGKKHLARQAFPVVAEMFEDVPVHALLGVFEGAGSGIPCKVYGGKIGFGGSGASPLGLFTNDKVACSSGSSLLLRPINDYDPVLLAVTGEMPGVGEPCGMHLDEWGITAGMTGFVCLSDPIDGVGGSGSGALDYVWVMRTSEPIVVVGEVVSSPPGASGDFAITSGTVLVLYRSGTVLDYAKSPVTGATPWSLPFWARGLSGSGMPDEGDVIEIAAALGVGLVYMPTGSGGGSGVNAWLGKVVGTIDIDQEGDVVIYRGDFPGETSGETFTNVANRFGCVTSGWVALMNLDGCSHPYLIAARCNPGSGSGSGA